MPSFLYDTLPARVAWRLCLPFRTCGRRGKGKTKIILWLSRNKPLAANFIIINTSQLPSPHIPHSHWCVPSRSEVKAFLMSCYFFKWVEGGWKKLQTTCTGQRQMSFCVLTRVTFTVVKSCFGVSARFLTGNTFWEYKHFEGFEIHFSVNLGFGWMQVKRVGAVKRFLFHCMRMLGPGPFFSECLLGIIPVPSRGSANCTLCIFLCATLIQSQPSAHSVFR